MNDNRYYKMVNSTFTVLSSYNFRLLVTMQLLIERSLKRQKRLLVNVYNHVMKKINLDFTFSHAVNR